MTMSQNKERVVIDIQKLIGKGYSQFWNFKGLYRVVKGSRASKKSKTCAYWYIIKMMNPKYSKANLLVIRKTLASIEGSCFNDLKWAIYNLGVESLWSWKTSPLEMTYIPTGQKIYFRGLDSPMRIASISVAYGHLCWMWVEEAYEIVNEEDFNMIDESIRGVLPEPLFQQVTLTFNPWGSKTWLKRRFFDRSDPNILAMTTTYLINEWLSDVDRKKLEDLKESNPRRFKVAGLGHWGVSGGQVYENYDVVNFNPKDINGTWCFGLDFGYSNDPSAFFVGIFDPEHKEIYVVDEFYKKEQWNSELSKLIHDMGYQKEIIVADSSAPKDISELRAVYGIRRIRSARKGKLTTILNGIGFIQNYHISIHPKCDNFLHEIENYMYKTDKQTGKPTNEPEDSYNHLMDAMRYALEPFIIGETFTFF